MTFTELSGHLPSELAWQNTDFNVVLSFTWAGALFALFHFSSTAQKLEPRFRRQGLDDESAILAAGVSRKIYGGLLLGLGSVLALYLMGLSAMDYGIAGLDVPRTTVSVLVGALIFVPIVGFSMRNPKMWRHYPEIRTRQFHPKAMWLSGLGWILYLIGFEYFFRGFLLFFWAQAFGVWSALAMTTSLYTLAHLPTNGTETMSTVPMGFIFGAMAIYTGSFVAPLLLHILIALTSDIVAARLNPDIEH